jgi:hypothetical protein
MSDTIIRYRSFLIVRLTMTSDYNGPMKTGLWWSAPDSWQTRYEAHLARRDKLARESRAADLGAQQAYRMWVSYPDGCKQSRFYWQQYSKLTERRKMLEHLYHEESREIRAIDNGYHEP